MTAPFNLENSLIITPGLQGPPGTVSSPVAVTADLASAPATVDGQLGFVESRQAYFRYAPADVQMPNGSTIIASSAGGNWLWLMSGNPELFQAQTAWNIDPVNGSDDGTETTVKTLAEVVRRWGTTSPRITTDVVITWLSDGPSSDPWTGITPIDAGGTLTLTGVTTLLDTFTIGTFTAPNYPGGALGSITASGKPSAYFAAFVGTTVLVDTTVGADFILRADLGTAHATINQPLVAPGTFGSDYATIANSDTVQVLKLVTIYAQDFESFGSFVWYNVTRLRLVSSGDQQFNSRSNGAAAFVECIIAPTGLACAPADQDLGCTFSNCFIGSAGGFSSWNGTGFFADCVFDGIDAGLGPESTLLFDTIVKGLHAVTNLSICNAYVEGNPANTSFFHANIITTELLIQEAGSTSPVPNRLWGPAGANASNGWRLRVSEGQRAQDVILITGTLQVDSVSTAVPWVSGSHAFGAAVTVTTANIDANGSLQNPGTGSGFFKGSPT